MTVVDDIQSAIKSNKAVLGFNESIKYIKTSDPKLVVIAENLPSSLKHEIENSVKVSKTKMEVFTGTSVELGIICGKPFPVSTLIVKG
ncbi:MAG: 50S ribosomal protein L30e [Candidatus Aenigmarchaeota archaeon]|nr:50S ribosomal protein L30e [Candidatus Aenigmarchaeota archaeon]